MKDVKIKDYTIHDVLEEYLKLKSPISPTIEAWAYADDLSPFSFSTVPGTDYKFQ
ncbi:MAG: hypothetical protein ACYCZ2_19990 [Lutibacter sp.]